MSAVSGSSTPQASPSPLAADPLSTPSTALVPATKKPINTRYSKADGEAIAWNLIFQFLNLKDQCAGSGVCVDWHNRAAATRELRAKLILGGLQTTPTLIKDFQSREDDSSVIFASKKWLGVLQRGALMVSDNHRTFADTPQRLPGITDPWVTFLSSHNDFAFFLSGADAKNLPNLVIVNANNQLVTRMSVDLALKGKSIPGDKRFIACLPENSKQVLAITNTGGIVRIDLSSERPKFTYVGRPVLPRHTDKEDSNKTVTLLSDDVGKMGNLLYFRFSNFHTAFFDLATGRELATKEPFKAYRSRRANGTMSFIIEPGEQATLSSHSDSGITKWKVNLQTDASKHAMEEIVAANARWVVLFSKTPAYGDGQHKYRLLNTVTGEGIAGTQFFRRRGGYVDSKEWLLEDWFITNSGNKLMLLHVPTNTETELTVTPPHNATATEITDVKLLEKEILVLISYKNDQRPRGLHLLRYDLPLPPSKKATKQDAAAKEAAAKGDEAPAAPQAPALPALATDMPRLEPRTREQLAGLLTASASATKAKVAAPPTSAPAVTPEPVSGKGAHAKASIVPLEQPPAPPEVSRVDVDPIPEATESSGLVWFLEKLASPFTWLWGLIRACCGGRAKS